MLSKRLKMQSEYTNNTFERQEYESQSSIHISDPLISYLQDYWKLFALIAEIICYSNHCEVKISDTISP